ncbi:MAG: hypothetical protein DRG78_02450 [Epsilonproteobacteria bacterium]|nr:MAG: hypothetical protein DRG78_02450 [Campylobacterota bacterium]
MNAVVAVQELIDQNKKRISILKKQLADNDAGINKMSSMARASSENGLEQSKIALEKNEMILKELQKHDMQELEKEFRLKEAIKRKNYYKYQKVRLKRDIEKGNDQKLEAMMIIDELPTDLNLNDADLFEIAETTIKLDLRIHDELDKELEEIKRDFAELLKNINEEDIGRLGMLQLHIPIITLHLSVLISNIKEIIKEEDLAPFKGLPKFEDWWIDELWANHQAYFGLYKWKHVISSLCITTEQKKAWGTIFSNWVFMKKALNKKGKLAFDFNFAFDSLMKHHSNLEEELDTNNLKIMEKIVQDITVKEDFHKFHKAHNIITLYLDFKREKLGFTEQSDVEPYEL